MTMAGEAEWGAARMRRGGVLVRLLLVALLFGALAWGLRSLAAERFARRECRRHLEQIYAALELYEAEKGRLPDLAFYPEDAFNDEGSLRVFLARRGFDPDLAVCPGTPAAVRRRGLSYVWNVKMNGARLARGRRRWLLTEISALSPDVPAPHMGHYFVLYSDGTIESAREAPPGLLEKDG